MGNPRKIRVVGAAIVRDGLCLAAQRPEGHPFAHMWELPGGKIEPGETPQQAVTREVWEELDLRIEVLDHIGQGVGMMGETTIVLDVYAARITAGQLVLKEHRASGWFGPEELERLPWPPADRPIIPVLRRYLGAKVGRRSAQQLARARCELPAHAPTDGDPMPAIGQKTNKHGEP